MNVVWPPRQAGFGLLHADNYTAVGEELYEATCRVTARFAAASRRPLRRTNNILARPGEEELAGLLSLYAASDIIVSSRLHGCIIAVAMGKKVIAVSGDFKVDAFMAAAGLEKWVCSQGTMEHLEVLLATVETQPPVTSFVAAARTQNTRVAAEVRAFLTGRPCGATPDISDGS
jgi:polysaccharide pyruvyl transferase WcaK-like protein